ncbi:MAG TPA: hypothetical protein VG847_06795 [Chitinophagaceae bacterium]|nr:hypothetical protein [Chitinophagaceae bacterium]
MKKYSLLAKLLSGLLLFSIFFSCSKDKNSTTGTYYYKATINNVSYNEPVTNGASVQSISGVNGTDDVVIYAGIINHVGGTSLSISKGLMHNFTTATQTDLKNFFATGSYPYSIDAQSGIQIEWQDSTSKVWSTSFGTGDQTGSNFQIVSVTDNPDSSGKYYVKVKATFNCIFYDDLGSALPVVNGEMVGSYGPLN